MLIIAIVIAACVGAHTAEERVTSASAFRPWALNDSTAFVFPRIAEKRNRGRRERLAAALRNDADAIAAALRNGVDWNSLGVAWPRGALRRLPAAFAALVAICVVTGCEELEIELQARRRQTERGANRPRRRPGSPPGRLRRRP